MSDKMTRKGFQKIVDRIAGYGDTVEELENKWQTGGQSGGSCWDDGDTTHYAESGEPEPEFESLDNILLEVAPQLSFLHYKKLSQVIKVDDNRENDYYGNYTDYAIKTITIDDLWDFLVQYDLV